MFITENIIDIGVADTTVETYGDVYPDNAKYMATVQELTEAGIILNREVTNVVESIYMVKTTFNNTEGYSTYMQSLEVIKMGAWMSENITILSNNKYEA